MKNDSLESESVKKWTKYAQDVLQGRTIKSVRYMSNDEIDRLGIYHKGLVFELDNGTLFWSSSDDEGNDAGAIHFQSKDEEDGVLPVL
jgi:hypothetical protein